MADAVEPQCGVRNRGGARRLAGQTNADVSGWPAGIGRASRRPHRQIRGRRSVLYPDDRRDRAASALCTPGTNVFARQSVSLQRSRVRVGLAREQSLNCQLEQRCHGFRKREQETLEALVVEYQRDRWPLGSNGRGALARAEQTILSEDIALCKPDIDRYARDLEDSGAAREDVHLGGRFASGADWFA